MIVDFSSSFFIFVRYLTNKIYRVTVQQLNINRINRSQKAYDKQQMHFFFLIFHFSSVSVFVRYLTNKTSHSNSPTIEYISTLQ